MSIDPYLDWEVGRPKEELLASAEGRRLLP